MQIIIEYLKILHADIETCTEYHIIGKIGDKRLYIAGFTSTGGNSKKIIGYLVRVGEQKSDRCMSQKSAIEFIRGVVE
jgi:hypothetical protein